MTADSRIPSFSVVTVSLNAERTIGDTIASVAAQDWPELEHIVIDGGSTDGTAKIVEAAAHGRLHFVSESDQGIYDAMNKGLALATGDYVGFLNADDFLAGPDSIRRLAAVAMRTGADCLLGDTQYVDSAGRPRGRLYSTFGFRPWWLRLGIQPPHPSFFARTELLERVGGFDTRFRIGADFDLIARLMLRHKGSWARAKGVIACFREGGLTTSRLAVKREIGREAAASLRALGQPFAGAAVQLRYPVKLLQLAAGAFQTRRKR